MIYGILETFHVEFDLHFTFFILIQGEVQNSLTHCHPVCSQEHWVSTLVQAASAMQHFLK